MEFGKTFPNGLSGCTKSSILNKHEFLKKKSNKQRRSLEYSDNSSKKSTTQWFKGFTKYITRKNSTMEDKNISDEVAKNIIFNILSQFIYYMSNFGVALESGNKLILYF